MKVKPLIFTAELKRLRCHVTSPNPVAPTGYIPLTRTLDDIDSSSNEPDAKAILCFGCPVGMPFPLTPATSGSDPVPHPTGRCVWRPR